MRRTALAVAVAAVAILAVAYGVAPHVHLARLERSLFAATDTPTAATLCRAILTTENPRAADVLTRYARQCQWCEFDPLHGVALLCDAITGKIHIVYVGTSGSSVATGDPALDKAVEAAIPKITSQTLSIGQPPHLFDAVHLLTTTASHADFVFRPQPDASWLRVRLEFDDGRLMASGSHDVSDAELSQWRKAKDWPKSW